METDYYTKYLKYKNKYLNLKNLNIYTSSRNSDNLELSSKLSEHSNKNKYINLRLNNLNLFDGLDNPPMTGGGKNKINIMLFKAEWCGHCQRFKPVWEQLSKKFQSKFNFIVYDSDKNENMMTKYKINGFPTILIQDGDIIKPYEDNRDLDTLDTFFNNLEPV